MDARFFKKVKRIDSVARWIITLGGISIIGSMLVMIIFMGKVTLPLFQSSEQERIAQFSTDVEDNAIVNFGMGPYLEKGYILREDGRGDVLNLTQNKVAQSFQVTHPETPDATILKVDRLGKEAIALLWSNGAASIEHLLFEPVFDNDGNRTIRFKVENHGMLDPEEGMAHGRCMVTVNTEGAFTRVSQSGPNSLKYNHIVETEDFMGDVVKEAYTHLLEAPLLGKINCMALNMEGSLLYVGTDQGELAAWRFSDFQDEPIFVGPIKAFNNASPITAIQFVFGEVSLLVGNGDGKLSAWNFSRRNDGSIVKIHDFTPHPQAITQLHASPRSKSFLSVDAAGTLRFNHLTSEKLLLEIAAGSDYKDLFLAEREDGLLVLKRNGEFLLKHLDLKYPEVSARALWSKVWYESYEEPAHVWQSSSASDDFEPKLSLVPLVFGSLKGAFYGMMFSLPLSIFAAIYVSHMMHPRMRSIVKPMIELMAAAPTVVIGFLGALWLSPRLEGNTLGIALALTTIPAAVSLGMLGLIKWERRTRGLEFLWGVPLVILGTFVAYKFGAVLSDSYFGGNLNLWLFKHFELAVDQRNCVVIAFALGFAVIPIIFTISEDALYNVPKHLTAAALAMGSSRWQTVRRVVLPMASPGIFAAAMIGFGRAVGETMIVLMATGNTPIIDISILNGMRTLSANIAVEIPEAPAGGGLYRILFLSAVLLFAMTFVVNTFAEVVRVRLQKKYKNL